MKLFWMITMENIICQMPELYECGRSFTLLKENPKIPYENLKHLVYELSGDGPQFWIATSQGAIATSAQRDTELNYVTNYNTSNSDILSNNVLSIAVGRHQLRWFGTDKGISAFYNNKWLTPAYQRLYPESLFKVLSHNRYGNHYHMVILFMWQLRVEVLQEFSEMMWMVFPVLLHMHNGDR